MHVSDSVSDCRRASGDGPRTTALRYRADIDGLRAVAVLSVLVYHIQPTWLPGGFTGVDMAIGIGMAVFAVSMGLHFLYLAATGKGVEHVSGTVDLAPAAPATPVPQRLVLLDELHRRRAISDTEYRQQRRRILRDI